MQGHMLRLAIFDAYVVSTKPFTDVIVWATVEVSSLVIIDAVALAYRAW